ncbi:MAG: hypothetical protein CSA20_02040 [Deltaproteobacteria bacterium]|nr:MAG: hypothetical protein CSB23_00070 [Deltaproteobacteria bacterium]PIE73655.1 MAG: hypothetical protein CSA20_02040 [Deltaproteobacteria bacterium]
MRTAHERQLKIRGLAMLTAFFIILAAFFTPIFPGKINGLDYTDNLFNMISKGSSDFIDEQKKQNSNFTAVELDLQFTMKSEKQAAEFARQLSLAGAVATASAASVSIKGNMAAVVEASLTDCRAMFDNDGKMVEQRYDISSRKALFNWWTGYKSMVKALNKEKKFKEAKFFGVLCKKAIEPAYNYFGIEAKPWRANILMIVLSLVFYVFYTIWYGFGILWLFEGMGLKIGH